MFLFSIYFVQSLPTKCSILPAAAIKTILHLNISSVFRFFPLQLFLVAQILRRDSQCSLKAGDAVQAVGYPFSYQNWVGMHKKRIRIRVL